LAVGLEKKGVDPVY